MCLIREIGRRDRNNELKRSGDAQRIKRGRDDKNHPGDTPDGFIYLNTMSFFMRFWFIDFEIERV